MRNLGASIRFGMDAEPQGDMEEVLRTLEELDHIVGRCYYRGGQQTCAEPGNTSYFKESLRVTEKSKDLGKVYGGMLYNDILMIINRRL